MSLKRLSNNYVYDIHILLSSENEIKTKIMTNKPKKDVQELIQENLPWNVSIDKIYSISSSPKIDFIDTDILV